MTWTDADNWKALREFYMGLERETDEFDITLAINPELVVVRADIGDAIYRRCIDARQIQSAHYPGMMGQAEAEKIMCTWRSFTELQRNDAIHKRREQKGGGA